MASLLCNVRRGDTDFVVFNGDMVSHMDSERQILDGFIDKAVEMFASEVPFYMVRGNHEGRGLFADRYPDYFPASTGMPYYTFRQGPVFFIVMDGGEIMHPPLSRSDSDHDALNSDSMNLATESV